MAYCNLTLAHSSTTSFSRRPLVQTLWPATHSPTPYSLQASLSVIILEFHLVIAPEARRTYRLPLSGLVLRTARPLAFPSSSPRSLQARRLLILTLFSAPGNMLLFAPLLRPAGFHRIRRIPQIRLCAILLTSSLLITTAKLLAFRTQS